MGSVKVENSNIYMHFEDGAFTSKFKDLHESSQQKSVFGYQYSVF